MKKRGQVQIQFNWIYVAVVGAILLIIFVNVALGVRKSAMTELSIDAINYFDEIFTSVQASENTENSITLPGLELEIAVDGDNCNYYTIKGSGLGGRSTEYVPLFSPDIIKTKVLSYSLGWDMPFRVNYFLLLTSPEVAYASVGTTDIFEDLPEHLTKEEINVAAYFENENYYKVKFFSTSQNPTNYDFHNSMRKLKDKDIDAVYFQDGVVKFYEKEGNSFVLEGESYYIDKATMMSAIYADNHGDYECNLMKAITRLNRFSVILKDRVNLIKSSDLLPLCSISSYTQAESLLTQLEEATRIDEVDQTALNNIKSIKEQLQTINTNLNKKSCPTVY